MIQIWQIPGRALDAGHLIPLLLLSGVTLWSWMVLRLRVRGDLLFDSAEVGKVPQPALAAVELWGTWCVICAVLWAQSSRRAESPATADEPTDEELMVLYVNGDAKAFDRLLGRYQRKVYGYIFKQIRDEYRATELFQDCFYKVVRAAHTFDPKRKFSTWLFTIVRNSIIDTYKKKKLRTLSMNSPIRPGDEKRTMSDFIPDKQAAEGEKSARLKQLEGRLDEALDKLNPDQKEVFMMRQFQGLAFADIAEVLSCPVNTAKTRMRYALQALRRELEDLL